MPSAARTGVRPIRSATSVATASAAAAGRVAGDDLDQAHQRRRVEEVHAADPLRALGPGGDRGHRERGGVGRQHRVGRAGRRQAANSSRLSSSRSGAASTTRSQPPRSSSSAAGEHAARRRLGLGCGPAAALGPAAEVRAQPLDPALQRLGVGVVKQGLVAAEARQLGDPGAHRPGARDSDPLDHGSAAAGGGGSPSQKLDRVAAEVDVVEALAGRARRAAEGADLARLGPHDDVGGVHLADDQDPRRLRRRG